MEASWHQNLLENRCQLRQAYLLKSKQLSEFATQLELEYVYAMISEGDQVYFTASSYTKKYC